MRGIITMDLNEDEIIEILKIIDESDFDELSIETENLKLVFGKSGVTRSQQLPNVNANRIIADSTES